MVQFDHPDVALRREVEEPSHAGAGVLRPLALVAMGQQQGQPGGQPPLGQSRRDELVDDDLGGVHEIAELGLPQHQRLGRCHAVAVLEAQGRQLGERAVVQLHRGQRPGQVSNRRDGGPGLDVVQHQVTLAEGTALGVLAGKADRHALGQE